MNSHYISYPVLQIRPYGLLVYDRIEYQQRPRGKQKFLPGLEPSASDRSNFDKNSGKGQYDGYLTPGARKRLKRAIQLIVEIAEPKTAMNFKLNKEFKFKLNFITLTLPVRQGTRTDKDIKKFVLDPWLKKAKRRWSLRSYIWRAERQKNGNLHFHITTDTYIPYDQLRDEWNKNLNALGFIDEFEKKHGHRHPNSTDVHATKKVKDLAAYFSKYMAKDEPTREKCTAQVPWARPVMELKPRSKRSKLQYLPSREEIRIDGKLWDCSRNLKVKDSCECLMEGDAVHVWNKVRECPEVKIKDCDHCSIAFLTKKQRNHFLNGPLKNLYDEWINRIRNIPDEIIKKPPEPEIIVPF